MFVRVVCRRVPPLQYLFYWRGQEVSCGLEDRVRGLRAKQVGWRYSASAEKGGWPASCSPTIPPDLAYDGGLLSLRYFERELSMEWLLFKGISASMERGE
jgi:hypothetical protein